MLPGMPTYIVDQVFGREKPPDYRIPKRPL